MDRSALPNIIDFPNIADQNRKTESLTFPSARIPNGCSDIAMLLGYHPASTVWDFNWVHSPESGMHPTDIEMADEHQAILPLARGEATALTLKLHPGLLDYMQEHAGVTNVIEVTDNLPAGNSGYSYSDHAISAQLRAKAQGQPALSDTFKGKVFCPSINTPEISENILALGGRPLITSRCAKTFNSKVRVYSQADATGYAVAPFVVLRSADELESKMNQLALKASKIGLDQQTTKYWVKFDQLAGGDGVLPYDPVQMDLSDVEHWIRTVRSKSQMPDSLVHPMIIDIDIGHLPDVQKISGNFNVQAVISDSGVHLTGVTTQRTKSGQYLGGTLPQCQEEKVEAAQAASASAPLLSSMQRDGYRGYVGVDVILTDSKDGGKKGYVLESNARLNCSTSLLSTSHWVADQSGSNDVLATNIKSTFKPLEDFAEYKRVLGSCMYQGSSSDFQGIIPVFLEFNERGAIFGSKVIAVAPDSRSMQQLERRYSRVLQSIGVLPK